MKRLLFGFVSTASIAAAIATGCGSSDDTSAPIADAGGSDATSAGDASGSDAATNDSGAPDAGADTGPSKPYVGSMSIQQQGVSARFFATTSATGPTCSTSVGQCTLIDCPIPDGGGAAVGVSAGDITISSPSLASSLVLHFASGGYFGDLSNELDSGESVTVSGEGGVVDSFSGSSNVAPATIAVQSPALDGGSAPVAIDVSKDFVVAWTNGAPGTTVSFALARTDVTRILEIDCSFDAASGTGTVASALLTGLGATTQPGNLEVNAESLARITTGNANVQIAIIGNQVEGSFTTH